MIKSFLLIKVRDAYADGIFNDDDFSVSNHRSPNDDVDVLTRRPRHPDDAIYLKIQDLANGHDLSTELYLDVNGNVRDMRDLLNGRHTINVLG